MNSRVVHYDENIVLRDTHIPAKSDYPIMFNTERTMRIRRLVWTLLRTEHEMKPAKRAKVFGESVVTEMRYGNIMLMTGDELQFPCSLLNELSFSFVTKPSMVVRFTIHNPHNAPIALPSLRAVGIAVDPLL